MLSCISISTEKKVMAIPVKIVHTVSTDCNKKPIVVAVIDTGFGVKYSDDGTPIDLKVKLCKYGHKDFTGGATSDRYGTEDEVPVDTHRHGSHIAKIIDMFGQKFNVNYCIVILKYYDPDADAGANLDGTIKAIKRATDIHADYINYSGGGLESNKEEKKAVEKFLDQGGKFVAAAGNEGHDVDLFPYYPASYDIREVVVGANDQKGHRISSSDYGANVRMELGKNVTVCDDNKQCITMTGTSQATAIATGKLLAQEKNTCN